MHFLTLFLPRLFLFVFFQKRELENSFNNEILLLIKIIVRFMIRLNFIGLEEILIEIRTNYVL